MAERKVIDPLTLALIEGRLNGLNEELAKRLMRQAFSRVTALVMDIGTTLLDKQERQVAIGNEMPVHTGGADICLKGILDWIGRDNIHPDDFIMTNDPFIVRFGHLPDWSFVRPIFYEGELIFYHFLRTHQYDAGGSYIGCYYPRTFDCHAEGLMIPPVKIMEGGEIDEKAYSIILRNVRGREMVRADNMLVYSSMKIVEKRILDLLRSYGKDTVLAACDEIISRTEQSVRKTISGWPAGVYRAERAADWDGTIDEPVWVRLTLTVKPEQGQLILDFSESDPQVDLINVPLGQVWSFVALGVAWSLPSGTPRNQGLMNCLTVITKKGTVLDPVYPATTGAQAKVLGTEIIECIQVALGQLVPKDTQALWGRDISPNLMGRRRDRIDPRTHSSQLYYAAPFFSSPSNGGMYGYDGTDGLGPAPLGGGVLRSSVEVEEWDLPYRLLHYEFLMDSCGHGQWRGGLGTRVDIVNTYDPKSWRPIDGQVMTGNSDGEKFGALGLVGGTEGPRTELGIIRRVQNVQLRTMDVQNVEPGDIIWTKSGGGGGYGNPLDREVEKVRRDVLNEYISIQVARDIYGVVIDPGSIAVDYQATEEHRQELKAKRS